MVVVIHHHKLYYATDSVPSILQMFTHLLLIITLYEVRSLTPIYKPGRLREPQLLAWGHTTSKWWRWDQNSGILAAELMLPHTTSVLSLQISPSAPYFIQLIHLCVFYLSYTMSFVRAQIISSKRISLLASRWSSVHPWNLIIIVWLRISTDKSGSECLKCT